MPGSEVSVPGEAPAEGGSRLKLRPWRPGDLEAVEDAARDPYITGTTSIPPAYTEEEGLAWIARQQEQLEAGGGYPFAIADAASDEALGFIGLWIETEETAVVGYWVRPAARGRGAAASALDLLARWAFRDLHVTRLELYIEPENQISQRVAEHAGFMPSGAPRLAERHGAARSFLVYSRWPDGRSASA